MRPRLRTFVLVVLIAVVGASCASDDSDPTTVSESPTLTFGDVDTTIEGNVATLPIDVQGVEIVKADGDTSGRTGHFHVFIDGDPVDEGAAIPRERGVVHSAENPVKLWGLRQGKHDLTVVVGDGTHNRIHGDLEDSVAVEVAGPSVWGKAPATVDEGDDVKVDLDSEGVEIMESDAHGDTHESGHYHVLVDPQTPPAAGKALPEPEEGSVFHTADDSVTIEGLEPGEHIIWIVVGSLDHVALDPPVMDKLTVTVA